jgi:hypothetical protein
MDKWEKRKALEKQLKQKSTKRKSVKESGKDDKQQKSSAKQKPAVRPKRK